VIRKLDDGATNDHVDRRGNTALHFAVRFGYIRIVQVKNSSRHDKQQKLHILAYLGTPPERDREEKHSRSYSAENSVRDE